MARMDAKKTKANSTTTDNKLNASEQSGSNKELGLEAIMARLDKLEQENAELKGEINPEKKAKERYQWPRLISYKMWWWEPVVNYEWFLKDPTKSDIYRKGDDWISNQYLKIELADWKKVDVEVNEFGKFHTLSEKMEAKDENGNVIVLGSNAKTYTFEVWDKEFTVVNKCIN